MPAHPVGVHSIFARVSLISVGTCAIINTIDELKDENTTHRKIRRYICIFLLHESFMIVYRCENQSGGICIHIYTYSLGYFKTFALRIIAKDSIVTL